MTEETTHTTLQRIETANAPVLAFDLLADPRRLSVLQHLSRTADAVSLGELAERITSLEGTPTADGYARVLTALHHHHLPKLSEAGVVRYDVQSETVELLDAGDFLAPYLELAADPSDRGTTC